MPVTLEIPPLEGLQRTALTDGPNNTLHWAWMQWFIRIFRILQMVKVGTGTPQAVVTAGVGTIFLRLDGGANTTLYVKEAGTGNTGWVGK